MVGRIEELGRPRIYEAGFYRVNKHGPVRKPCGAHPHLDLTPTEAAAAVAVLRGISHNPDAKDVVAL